MEITRVILMIAPKEPSEAFLNVLSLLSGLIIQDDESLTLFETADTLDNK